MRLKPSMAIRLALLIVIVGVFRFADGKRGNMSETPMDNLRVDESAFIRQAIQKMWEERRRMGYTPLVQMRIPVSKV